MNMIIHRVLKDQRHQLEAQEYLRLSTYIDWSMVIIMVFLSYAPRQLIQISQHNMVGTRMCSAKMFQGANVTKVGIHIGIGRKIGCLVHTRAPLV